MTGIDQGRPQFVERLGGIDDSPTLTPKLERHALPFILVEHFRRNGFPELLVRPDVRGTRRVSCLATCCHHASPIDPLYPTDHAAGEEDNTRRSRHASVALRAARANARPDTVVGQP